MTTQTIFFIGIAAFTALALSFGFYFYRKKNKRPKHWVIFSVLRFVTFFSLFLLLINPQFKNKTYTIEKPSLVLAVDNSASIKNAEQADAVNTFIHKLKENPEIQERFSIETYSFGERFQQNDSISFSDKQTNIYQAFLNLRQLYHAKKAPTLLITDGNQTIGQDYTFQANQYKQDLYPIVVGDTTQYTDLKITQLNANRYAFLNNKFPVEVFVNYTGTQAINQQFEIKQGGKVLFSKQLSFDAHKTSAIVEALLPAQAVGIKTYSAVIAPLSDEKNTINNTKNFAVEVIDEKTNVLLLSDILHPDLGAFKKAIEHNKQRSVTIKKLGEDEIDLGKFQLVILYQPDAKFAPVYQELQKLGMNTLTVTGVHTDYRFLNEVQGFFKKELTGQTEEYVPSFNAGYENFQQENIGFDDFPPLVDAFGDLSFTTRYNTLLYQSINGYTTANPLLATVEDNERKYGFLFGENSWRWRAKSFLDTDSFETYDEFIGKLVQYLASSKHRQRLSLTYDSFYNAGENKSLQAFYVDRNYEFDPRAKLSAVISNKKTNEKQTFPFLLKNNFYQLDISNLSPGEYSFTVSVQDENVAQKGNFTVVDFDVEKQFLNANLKKMRQISTNSLYYINQEQALIKELLANKDYQAIQKSSIKLSPLIEWYYLLLIIVLCLSVEWFLRKYNGLI